MSEDRTGASGRWRGAPEEEAVRRLLQEAGPRPALPPDDLVAIEAAARAEWDRRYGMRRAAKTSGRMWLGLAAAALVGAIGLVWWGRTGSQPAAPPAPVEVGSIEVLTGVVRIATAAGSLAPVTVEASGRRLLSGSSLETGDEKGAVGRVALRLRSGASVRLDTGTRLRLLSPSLVELASGAVYVDSGADPHERGAVAVRTSAGLFREQGTQFEVRTEGSGPEAVTRLRVREGRVALTRGEGSALVTGAGHELTLRGDGEPVQSPAAGYGPEWEWVLQTAPALDIEGMKVKGFLDWISRESGLRVVMADAEAASLADSVVLHGSIRHLTPVQAPGVVLSSSGLGHRLTNGTMVVFVQKDGGR